MTPSTGSLSLSLTDFSQSFINSIKHNWSLTKIWSVTARPAPQRRVIFCLYESIQNQFRINSESIQTNSSAVNQIMFIEDTEIIDVDVHGEDWEPPIQSESIHESIQSSCESIHWILASEAKHLTRLDQSGFTRTIKELTQTHQIPLAVLRRGNARNTEYSQVAIDLAKLLNSPKPGDREAFEKLKQSLVCPPTVGGTGAAIVLRSIERNLEVARQSSSASDQNLTVISGQILALMDK